MSVSNRNKITPRQVITLLGVGTGISILGDSTLFTVLPNPDISAQLGVTLTMVGLLLGANRATRLLINSPVGILYERMPRRLLLITSLVLAAISNILYAIGFGFWPLLIGRVCWGFSWSLLWIGCKTVILEISDEKNRGRFNGHYQMLFLFGIGLCSLLGGIFTDQFGFRIGQLVSAAIIFAAALMWFFFLPETRTKNKGIKNRKNKSSKKEILLLPILFSTSLTIFITRFIGWGVMSATAALWISNLFDNGIHFYEFFLPIATLTGIFSAIKMIPGIASAPFAGYMSDKLGKRWIVITTSLLVGGVGIWLMSESIATLSLFGALLSPIIGGGVETIIPAVIGDRTEKNIHGRMLGIVYTFGDLGAMLGPMAALSVLDSSLISLRSLYRICVGLLLFAAFISVLQVTKEKKPE